MADPTLALLVLLHAMGAAVWFGGAVWIAIANRALKARLEDAPRRDLVRHLGRAASPALWGALVVAAASGAALWWQRGSVAPALGWGKVALALATAAFTMLHVRSGRTDSPSVKRSALLGIGTLLAGIALFALGAWMRTS